MAESYSVQDVSAATGVSVQAARAWCKRNGIQQINGKWQLSPKEYFAALGYYLEKSNPPKEESNESPNLSQEKGKAGKALEDSTVYLLKQVELLSEQLAVKDAQLAEKDTQIHELTQALTSSTTALHDALSANKALSGSTALTIAADRKEALLEHPVAQEQASNSDEEPSPQPSRFRRVIDALFH